MQIIPSHKDYQSNAYSPHSNVSVIDIHTGFHKSYGTPSSTGAPDSPQIAISPETQSRLGKQLINSMSSAKPILPKPQVGSSSLEAGSLSVTPATPNSSSSFQPTGYGPQGPTVSIHHLIAAHRKDNPHVVPLRYLFISIFYFVTCF